MDAKTRSVLDSILPELRKKAERILAKGRKEGYDLRAISGDRTCEEQDELYAKGRTAPGNIVTNAPCGKSYHNYRSAIDFAFFKDGKYWQDAPWEKLGMWCNKEDLEWGGTWRLRDYPHCQLKDQNINELYANFQRTGKLEVV